ncbi:MAG: Rieske (2Fe-2S) protein [Bacteroidota bacterium]
MNISRRNFLTDSAVIVCGAMLSPTLQSCSVGKLLYASRNIPVIEGEPLLLLANEPLLRNVGGAVKKRFSVINNGDVILIIRLSEKEFVAYAAQCTHMGAEVGAPVNNVMTCPFHGSQYNAANGAVMKGPAEEPLQQFTVLFDEVKQELRIQ